MIIDGNTAWNLELSENMFNLNINENKNIWTYKNLPLSLYDSLIQATNINPNKIAIVDDELNIFTYKKFKQDVDNFANYLFFTKKINQNSSVALLLYNSYEFCVALYSLSKIGALTLPLPTKYSKCEIDSLLSKILIDLIIVDSHFKIFFTDYHYDQNNILISDKTNSIFGFNYLLTKTYLNNFSHCFNLDNDAILMFTSGTTSLSKGVVLKNYSISHAILTYQKILNINKNDKTIIPIPIYHITGIVALLGLFVNVGGTIYLHKFFDAERIINTIISENITFLHASPTAFSLLLKNYKENNTKNLPSVLKLACGSSNMPIKCINLITKWMNNASFHTVYGLTETSSPATIFPSNSATSNFIGSSGIPIPGIQLKIESENGKELEPYEVGEVLLKGTVLLDRYYNTPNYEGFKDGWLKTGDLGYFTSSGYLYILDRKKDMINRGGEKICSIDVENAILTINEIENASVVGIPDETYGEIPVAMVELEKNYDITEDQIKNILRNKIAKYKIPEKIIFVDQIPLTPNSKIDKKKIRETFLNKTNSIFLKNK